MTNEEMCLRGICCDCNGPNTVWTEERIKAAKEDMGMDDEDDFADCCEECGEKYKGA